MSALSEGVMSRIRQAFGTSQDEQGWAIEFIAALNIALKANEHLQSTQAVSPAVAAASGAGASPIQSLLNATDAAGHISITPGGAGLASGGLLTVTFASPYAVAPVIQLTPGNALAAAAAAYVTSTVNGFTVNLGSAPSAANYLWNYTALQTQ